MYSDDEDITKLIAKPPIKYEIPPMYMSKYRSSIRSSASSGKSAHKSLGVPKVSLNPPTQYLKKHSRVEVKRTNNHKHYRLPDYQHKLPAWEPIRLSNKSAENIRKSSKNFQKENIQKVRTSVVKQPKLNYTDDRRGNSWPPKPIGRYSIGSEIPKNPNPNRLMKGSINENDSGARRMSKKIRRRSLDIRQDSISGTVKSLKTDKVSLDSQKDEKSTRMNVEKSAKTDKTSVDSNRIKPIKNITEKPQNLRAEKESLDTDLNKSAKNITEKVEKLTTERVSSHLVSNKSTKKNTDIKKMCHFIDEDERAELLRGMKKKWEEMMKQFQALPFLTDTPPKAKRKAKMEQDLKQLEKDIDLIERHAYIYVYSDDEYDRY